MWIARENTRVKTARNFHFKTKNLLKWTMLESRQKTKRKVVRLNYILGFIFNFVLLIIYIALQLFEIVHVVAHRAIKLKLLVALVSFNSPLATVRPSIFSPAHQMCMIIPMMINTVNFTASSHYGTWAVVTTRCNRSTHTRSEYYVFSLSLFPPLTF